MKKTLIILVVLQSFLFNAQQKVDSTLVDIPYIGKNGGAHLLNWNLNKDRSKIYIYAYSHINGSQIVTNDLAINEARKEQNDKSFFGKLLTNSMGENHFENTVIPVVLEKKISTSDFSQQSNNKKLFHKVDKIPEGDNVYFKRTKNIINITSGIKTGQKIKHHYKNINIPFVYAPKYNSEIINATYIETKGDGILGLKNLRPILIKKRGFFTFTDQKGYISKTESKNIIDFKKDEKLKDYEFVNNSDSNIGDLYFAWFSHKDDLNKFQLVTYNKKGKKLETNLHDFKIPRKHVVINKKVYSKDLKTVTGFINIFGYHKKGKKNRDIYPKNKFDVIYSDKNGKVIFKKQIIYGTEKVYKRVLKPIIIFDTPNGLEFVNNYDISLFKSNYEVFLLNNEGEINVSYTSKYYQLQGEKRINYFNYLSDYERIDTFGDFYIVKKTVKETLKSTNQSALSKKVTEARVNYTILDKTFKPLKFLSFDIASNIMGKIKYQTAENSDKEIITLIKKNNLFYMLKITSDTEVPNFKLTPLKIAYTRGAKPDLYFGKYSSNFALVTKKDRSIYFMTQFYDLKKYNAKIIDKVGITKIKY